MGFNPFKKPLKTLGGIAKICVSPYMAPIAGCVGFATTGSLQGGIGGATSYLKNGFDDIRGKKANTIELGFGGGKDMRDANKRATEAYNGYASGAISGEEYWARMEAERVSQASRGPFGI